jgi:hypothetical protein
MVSPAHQTVDGAGKLDSQRLGHNGESIPTTTEMTGTNRALDAARPSRRQKRLSIKGLFDRMAFSPLEGAIVRNEANYNVGSVGFFFLLGTPLNGAFALCALSLVEWRPEA